MIITRSWISKYMNLDKISNDQITIAFNSLGFEVEETLDTSKLNKGLVVGYVKESKKIPDTHLAVNQVELAPGKVSQIVCGAPNVGQGQYVIVAPVGATIAKGLTMSEKELQGYKSEGMICALNEIGFKDNVLTELDLDSIYEIKSLNDLNKLIGKGMDSIGFDDYTWDIDLTLNRSDALAATQMLKELGNYFKQEIKYDLWDAKIKDADNKLNVEVSIDSKVNDVVNTLGVSELKTKIDSINNLDVEDDLWLKHCGVKSTENSIYDLANGIALQMGQPVVLIDADKLSSNKITVTLDKYKDSDDEVLVLKNDNKIIDVLGDEVEPEFRVEPGTKNVLVIYLNLDPVFMRKQQKVLNINSIAIQRFIKPEYANKFEKTNEVLKNTLAKYSMLEESNKLVYVKGPEKINNKYVVSLKYINDTLGTNLSFADIQKIFEYLDFELKQNGDDIEFVVDPNRIDIYGPKDICEEIARLYGYDNIPEVALTIEANMSKNNLEYSLQTKVEEYLIGKGFNNIKTYSLTSAEDNEQWNLLGLKNPVKLMSPLSKLREVYRLDLSKSIIDTVVYNANKDHKDTKLFEVADIYHDGQTHERHLAFSLSGDVYNDFRNPKNIEADFFFAKGILEDIFNLYQINLLDVNWDVVEDLSDNIHPYINAKISLENKLIGFIYKLNPQFEAKNKIRKTFVAEINLDVLYELANKKIELKEISKFQSSTRDISVEANNDLSYKELIADLIKNVNYVTDYHVIDIYTDDEMKKNNTRAIAISFTFNNVEKQLTDKDIEGEWNILLDNAKKLGLKVR